MTALYLYNRRPLCGNTRADNRLVTDWMDARHSHRRSVLDFAGGGGMNSRHNPKRASSTMVLCSETAEKIG
jgi:hypothetical protein